MSAGLLEPLLRFVVGRFGIGGIVALVVGFFVLQSVGIDPVALMSGGTGGGPRPLTEADKQAGAFSEVILAETEDSWTRRFAAASARYQAPRMVLFAGQVKSACGFASSAMGPFYCPADKSVYLDTSFFDQLARRFGAPGAEIQSCRHGSQPSHRGARRGR